MDTRIPPLFSGLVRPGHLDSTLQTGCVRVQNRHSTSSSNSEDGSHQGRIWPDMLSALDLRGLKPIDLQSTAPSGQGILHCAIGST